MQVLGDLIRLPDDPSSLPLPWWHRAPLGLQSETWCHLSIVASPRRPVGDLLISVLDPYKWPTTVAIQCRREDEPGVVSDAISVAHDTNIALAESVTMEAGTEHEITLICETLGKPTATTLRRRLKASDFRIDSTRTYPKRDLLWTRSVKIDSGWINSEDWRKEIQERFAANPNFESVDLSKAVISADTGNRLLRFVFPYRGARTIEVEHLDTPGALRRICGVLFDHKLNVLSLLLRRGGAKPNHATLVAACEPEIGTRLERLFERVKKDIKSLPPEFRTQPKVSSGLNAARVIAPREANTVVARVPKSLVQRVKDEKAGVGRGRTPVFFSRRFVNERRALQLGREVTEALLDNGCEVLEASPQNEVREQTLIFLEVTAKMWVAKAGIVLVTGLTDLDALGKNLPHEFGFLQGQTKPVLLLVEGGEAGAFRAWSNIDGVYAPRFPKGEEAVDRTSTSSVYQIVTEWTKRIRPKRRESGGSSARPVVLQ